MGVQTTEIKDVGAVAERKAVMRMRNRRKCMNAGRGNAGTSGPPSTSNAFPAWLTKSVKGNQKEEVC